MPIPSRNPHPAAQGVWPGWLVLAAQVVRQLLQRRVNAGAVQALRVVVNDQLPIGRHVVRDALTEPELVHAPGSKLLFRAVELLCEGA